MSTTFGSSPSWPDLGATAAPTPVTTVDPALGGDLLAHLEVQITSARRMRQIVLGQASAIRRRAVRQVVEAAGELQVEMHRRELIERDRFTLMERAARALGLPAVTIGFSSVLALMDAESAELARARTSELRDLLVETEREHELNRALMSQELSFLDHLLGLAGGSGSYAAHAAGSRRNGSDVTRIRTNANVRRRVFDLEA